MELFRPIIDFPGYEISNFGRVKSLPKIVSNGYNRGEKFLKISFNKGYPFVTLYNNRHSHPRMIHRLKAIAFIPNPDNKAFVNHKDKDPSNHDLNNLEWSNDRENISHAYLTSGKKTSIYTGVCWDKRNCKWMAYIKVDKKVIHLGRFINEDDAGRAYSEALTKYKITNKYIKL